MSDTPTTEPAPRKAERDTTMSQVTITQTEAVRMARRIWRVWSVDPSTDGSGWTVRVDGPNGPVHTMGHDGATPDCPHADYPHTPNALYDCRACERGCPHDHAGTEDDDGWCVAYAAAEAAGNNALTRLLDDGIADYMAIYRFDAEYVVHVPGLHGDRALTIEISAKGGGLVGETHAGGWIYRVRSDGTVMDSGADLHTPTPHTHAHVAAMLGEQLAADGAAFLVGHGDGHRFARYNDESRDFLKREAERLDQWAHGALAQFED